MAGEATGARLWLQSGQAPAARAAEVVRALALLSGQVAVTPAALKPAFGEDLELALVDEAEARARLDLVAVLVEHAAHKATAKLAKKVLFRAKQRGVAVPEPAQAPRTPVRLAATPDPLPSWATAIEGDGSQLLLLGGWDPSEGAWSLAGVLSETDGLLSAWYLQPSSRTHQRDLFERYNQGRRPCQVQVPEAFVAGRMRWGLDIADGRQRPVEGDHLHARRLLAAVEPVLASDIAIDLDPEDEQRLEQHLAVSATLNDDPTFARWLAGSAQVRGWQEQAKTQLQALPETERSPATAQVRAEVVTAWLSTERRQALAERLDVLAWLAASAGRKSAALLAVVTAKALRDTGRSALAVPAVARAVELAWPLERV